MYATCAVAAGCLVWLYRRSTAAVADAATQTSWRDRVECIAANSRSESICYNVLYTAALYAVDHTRISLDTWTMVSEHNRGSIKEWMVLKGRERMAMRALASIGASKEAIAAYQRDRARARAELN